MSSLVAWSGPTNLARLVVDEQNAAVAKLPGGADVDPFERLAAAFIVGYPANSQRAYLGDLRSWARWCMTMDVHPFDARRHHVDAWVRALTTAPTERTGKPMASASVRRRLSAVSKFYKYGIEVGVLTYSPVDQVRRPAPDDQMHTVALTSTEVDAILDVAEAHSPRYFALVSLLAYNGVRIDEALGADVDDYSFQRGHRVLWVTRKGGKRSSQPLAPPTVRALDAYLADDHPRAAGPLFLDRAKANRLPYASAFQQIRRLALRAGVASAAAISPHSFRSTFVTEALDAGVPLQDVQDAAGHANPATTRLYDRNRLSHDRHPTYVLAGRFRRSKDPDDGS